MDNKKFLSNEDGGKSIMRLINAFIVLIIMGNWTYINIVTETLTPLGGTALALIVSSFTAKVAEKAIENGKSKVVPGA